VGPGYRPTYIADFDGDGKADILWEKHPAGRWITFMAGAAARAFAPVPQASPGWQIAGAGDFNGDGRADLLWMDTANPSQYWIYLLDGSALIGNAPLFAEAPQYANVQPYRPRWIFDYDGDGKADIAWQLGVPRQDGVLEELGDLYLRVVSMQGLTSRGGGDWSLTYPGWAPVDVGNFDDNSAGFDVLWQNKAQPSLYSISIYPHGERSPSFVAAPGYVGRSR
jgi:hypothetical protein